MMPSLACVRVPILVAALACGVATTLAAQSRPDLTGLWDGATNSTDIVRLMQERGQPVPFTVYGATRYKNTDLAKNPNGFCLPPGPSRAITGPSPFYILQHAGAVAILFENHGVYRLIYTDGTRHPEDIQEYPAFMGHSVGRWEKDTLVVDTVGVNDRTWLDTNGLEHSDQLRLTETFQRTSDDVIRYSVTYDDPVFFTRPWTLTLDLKRLTNTRLIEYVCNENEKDRGRLMPTPRPQ